MHTKIIHELRLDLEQDDNSYSVTIKKGINTEFYYMQKREAVNCFSWTAGFYSCTHDVTENAPLGLNESHNIQCCKKAFSILVSFPH
jgi:hypothetical protein